jgi:hypothetical protein
MHDNLWFVSSSTNSGTTNFKFVYDVYINGSQVIRSKVFPSPSAEGSYGVFNASPMVRSFVTNYFEPSGNSILVASNDKIKVDYQLSLGYEQGSVQDKYFRFVNKGVKGTNNTKADNKTPYSFKTSSKAVPVSSIEKWLSYNKLKSVAVKKYTKLGAESKAIQGNKSLAWAIARSIHTKGLRSTHYFDKAVAQIFNKEFIENISVAVGGDVLIQIKQTVNESKNGNNNNK